MKISIEATAIAEAATWAVKGISPRPPFPILSGLLVEAAADGTVTFTGYDYETFSRATAAGDVMTAGQSIIPGKMLADILSKLPAKNRVFLEASAGRVIITSGKSKYTLATYDDGQFPALPGLPPFVGVVDGDAFSTAVNQTKLSVSTDQKLEMYGNIRVTVNGDRLAFHSTDRYRMAEVFVPWQPEDDQQQASWYVKARRLEDAAKITAGELEVFASDSSLAFRSGNRVLGSNLVDCEWPDITRLFPNKFPTTVTYDRDTLIEAVSRSSLVAESMTPVKLTITEDETELDTSDGESANGHEFVESRLEGDGIEVRFQPRYILDALNTMPAGDVCINFSGDPKKPAVVTPAEPATFRHLMMPQISGK